MLQLFSCFDYRQITNDGKANGCGRERCACTLIQALLRETNSHLVVRFNKLSQPDQLSPSNRIQQRPGTGGNAGFVRCFDRRALLRRLTAWNVVRCNAVVTERDSRLNTSGGDRVGGTVVRRTGLFYVERWQRETPRWGAHAPHGQRAQVSGRPFSYFSLTRSHR